MEKQCRSMCCPENAVLSYADLEERLTQIPDLGFWPFESWNAFAISSDRALLFLPTLCPLRKRHTEPVRTRGCAAGVCKSVTPPCWQNVENPIFRHCCWDDPDIRPRKAEFVQLLRLKQRHEVGQDKAVCITSYACCTSNAFWFCTFIMT